MALTYQASKSGYYFVTLTKVFTYMGFDYKPSHTKTMVNEDILKAMIAEDAVAAVVPA